MISCYLFLVGIVTLTVTDGIHFHSNASFYERSTYVAVAVWLCVFTRQLCFLTVYPSRRSSRVLLQFSILYACSYCCLFLPCRSSL